MENQKRTLISFTKEEVIELEEILLYSVCKKKIRKEILSKLSKETITLEKIGYRLAEKNEKLERYTCPGDELQEVCFYKDTKKIDITNSLWKFTANEILAIYNKATELFCK